MSGVFPEGRGVPGGVRGHGGSRPRPGCRADRGLITLEWLLVVGAVAGLAASSAVIVQQVLDDHSEVPADPLVRMLEADVAAAWVAVEAQAAFNDDPSAYTSDANRRFADRCAGVSVDFGDVVADATAVWVGPDQGFDPGDPLDDTPAQCTVNPRPNLGS